ncbi:MAG TPA: BMP family ABC transporter substrate-binding protein [Actinobacteria bacterium]|nr:BMP family ABC transporter substrate-binding protein [Actinomycetota bacterium]
MNENLRRWLPWIGIGAAVLVVIAIIVAGGGGGETPEAGTSTTAAETSTTAGEATTTSQPEETTTTAPPAEPVKVGMAYDIGGRGDKSFNDSAAAGLDKAKADFGIEAKELEPSAGGENREENLRLLAEAGYNPVFAIGFAFAEAVDRAAQDFPETTFAIVDSVVEQPNVLSLVFAEHEGSALVGAAAALKSETGKIGFIGGVNIGLIQKFEAGYRWGAQQVNPDIEILSTYLTEPPDFSGFNDPAKGKEAALAMFEQGADIVYHAAGGSGTGLFQAAKEVSEQTGSKVWGIGVDSDQYNTVDPELQDYVLTSMLKRVDVAVYTTIKNFVEGVEQEGVIVFNLESDGVGYSTSGGFVDDIVDQLEELKGKIVSGELEVPDALG